MSIRELQKKEVINTRNCASLGFVADIEFDQKCGKITAIVVPGPGKICLSVRKRDAVCDSMGMYTADRGGYYTGMCGGRLLCKGQSQNNIKAMRKNLLTDCGR